MKRRSQVLRRCLLTLGTSIVVRFRYVLGSCSVDWAAVCGQPVLHDTTSTYATGAQPHSMPAMFLRLTPLLPLQMQLAFICIVYPSLVVTYIGQASYLSVSISKASEHVILCPHRLCLQSQLTSHVAAAGIPGKCQPNLL